MDTRQLSGNHVQRAFFLSARKEYTKALQEIARAIEMDGENAEAFAAHGVILLQTGKPRYLHQAVNSAEQALALDPQCVMAHYVLGLVKHQRRLPQEAREHIEDALKLAPTAALLHLLLAKFAMENGDAAAAWKLVDTALSHEPADLESLTFKAHLFIRKGPLEAARDFIKDALALHPEAADLHLLLGQTELKLASGQAQAPSREGLRLAPDNEYARYQAYESMVASTFLYNCFYRWLDSLCMRRLSWLSVVTFCIGASMLGICFLLPEAWGNWRYTPGVVFLVWALIVWWTRPLLVLVWGFNSRVRHLIPPRQLRASWFAVGYLTGAAVVSSGVYFLGIDGLTALTLVLFGVASVLSVLTHRRFVLARSIICLAGGVALIATLTGAPFGIALVAYAVWSAHVADRNA